MLKKIAAFQNKTILIVGDLILDEYVVGNNYRISDEAPVPILRTDSFEVRLGGAANVARNVKSLGCNVLLCGTLGLGYSSIRFYDLLVSNDISSDLIISSSGIITTTKTRILIQNQQVARYDYEKIILDDDVIDRLHECIRKVDYTKIDAIIVSDYNKGVISNELVEILRSTGVPIIIDPKPSNNIKYNDVFCLTPNKKEFKQILGSIDIDDITMMKKSKQFIKKNRIKHLVVTAGEDGAFICSDNICQFIEGEKKQIVNIIGAGDTFISALTVSLVSGIGILGAVEVANIASCIVVSKKYTSVCILS